jgi:phosphoesterase RecJ-like protein
MVSSTPPHRAPTGLGIDPARRRAARRILRLLKPSARVVLTTHVNTDGDGAGSGVALWRLLDRLGVDALITNPTPFPDRFGFLLDGIRRADRSRQAVRAIERADAIVVLDIADLGRLGHLGRVVERCEVPVACIDHHASNGDLPPGPRLVDPAACATGELVYDLARVAGWTLDPATAQALYVAILTDTGGFRFANTTPRTLRIAGDLLTRGVDAERVYREVYASESEGKIRLIAEVLQTLVVEQDIGLAWMTIPEGALERLGVEPDELEGMVEFARSIRGVRLALLFRHLASGRIKVSFRSVGNVDVARLAERFDGGGHRRAAGASLDGPMDEARERVLAAARSVAAL